MRTLSTTDASEFCIFDCMTQNPSATKLNTERKLRLGFVPLVDCAPLVVAYEMDLFSKYGLDVKLCRELGWATIRDKVIYGELDAAQAVAGLALAATCGWGSVASPCVTGMILNANGNGITLSNLLYAQGVTDIKSFKRFLLSDSKFIPTLGTVSPFSSHNFLLRQWLRSGGIDPDRDVRIVVVPPPQVCQNLKAGNLDGFCVGEPWNSLAVQSRLGWTVVTSVELSKDHPEKILLVREDFAEKKPEQHLALMAALLEACRWCDQPENLSEVISLLCRPEYLNLPSKVLQPSLSGRYDYGNGRKGTVEDFMVFSRNNANELTPTKVKWIAGHLVDNGFSKISVPSAEVCQRVFRPDLYQEAQKLVSQAGNSLSKKTKNDEPRAIRH
jgi:ABC-type nitrate/sulfonate/bicarbonate transport system substrate-binding protein